MHGKHARHIKLSKVVSSPHQCAVRREQLAPSIIFHFRISSVLAKPRTGSMQLLQLAMLQLAMLNSRELGVNPEVDMTRTQEVQIIIRPFSFCANSY